MPYGVTNAPAVFQAFVNKIFKDMLNCYVIVYIDDLLIYSTNREEHACHVRTILTRLLQYQLYAKAEKCEFHKDSITFLGYVISRWGVEMDADKVKAVTDWPEPTTVKKLQRFLGFAVFYPRFIRNYSSIAHPLTTLLCGKPRQLHWTEWAQTAFDQLKQSFTIAPILRHLDPNLPFIVEVDASNCWIRAVLSQGHGNPRKFYPCAFFSRKLTPAEISYDVSNRELLSVKESLEEW
ncbi:hypothetical protein QTP70_003874 [Hemibagrus guttatus]|uniref:ribonuclease H n=1 Tax=Hemibagrus guttatus TaxID=175788 RepID=A0AAE0PSB0_9TELE|nr:hypothetical protein QTP70_003874 [Hemibagrus guttatus]KAK3522857.1 hypothetical protein QTP86_005662 [Hemibagrus guttatus]